MVIQVQPPADDIGIEPAAKRLPKAAFSKARARRAQSLTELLASAKKRASSSCGSSSLLPSRAKCSVATVSKAHPRLELSPKFGKPIPPWRLQRANQLERGLLLASEFLPAFGRSVTNAEVLDRMQALTPTFERRWMSVRYYQHCGVDTPQSREHVRYALHTMRAELERSVWTTRVRRFLRKRAPSPIKRARPLIWSAVVDVETMKTRILRETVRRVSRVSAAVAESATPLVTTNL